MGWIDLHDWLGIDKQVYRNFEDARQLVRSLKLAGQKYFKEWAKSEEAPKDIPMSPDYSYRNKGWIDWYDWLGKPRPGEDLDSSN